MSVVGQPRRRARVRTRPGTRAAECERAVSGARMADETPTLFTDLGGEPTLEDVISGAWEGLAAHHPVACPLCEGEMVAVYGAHARPSVGRCGDCGTELS
jgi:hypothetical protein